MTDDKLPCVNGCLRRGTEDTDTPVPLLAKFGPFCGRCYGRAEKDLQLAAPLVEHIRSLVAGTPVQRLGEPRAALAAESDVPFNENAVTDADTVYAMLVKTTEWWARRLGVQPPGPAARAQRTASGEIVGLPGLLSTSEARYAVGVLSGWLGVKLTEVFLVGTVEEVNRLRATLHEIRKLSNAWPVRARPRYSDMPHRCGGRIAVYPPEFEGQDEHVQCDRCGQIIDFDDYTEQVAKHAEVLRNERNRKRRERDARRRREQRDAELAEVLSSEGDPA